MRKSRKIAVTDFKTKSKYESISTLWYAINIINECQSEK